MVIICIVNIGLYFLVYDTFLYFYDFNLILTMVCNPYLSAIGKKKFNTRWDQIQNVELTERVKSIITEIIEKKLLKIKK